MPDMPDMIDEQYNIEELKTVVFLDRDGTINVDHGYIGDPGNVELIPGAARAIKALNESGIKVVIITNQSGIGRGFFSESDLHAVNDKLLELLRIEGVLIDGIYHCPHLPTDGCECRKPGTALIERASKELLLGELSLNVRSSFVVGDKLSDLELGSNIGASSVLVLTGKGRSEQEKLIVKSDKDPGPDHVAKDLWEASQWILLKVKEGG